MKIIYRILSIIYSLTTGIILICLFPILLPLNAFNKEPLFLYRANDKVNIWFKEKIYGRKSDIDELKKETIKKLSDWANKIQDNE